MVQTRPTQPLSPLARGSGLLYRFLAASLTSAIVVQVFLAGLGILVNPNYFAWHGNFAHFIEFIPLVMLLFGVIAKLDRRTLLLTTLTLVLVMLQYVFLHLFPSLGLTPLRALHAVNALALFWLSLQLGRKVQQHLESHQRDLQVQTALSHSVAKEKEVVS
jgi:Family of unknown function (DUF6220)